MSHHSKHIEPDPAYKALSAREEAARQLKDSKTAAQEVANLCAQAVKAARHHKIPHAGVGGADNA